MRARYGPSRVWSPSNSLIAEVRSPMRRKRRRMGWKGPEAMASGGRSSRNDVTALESARERGVRSEAYLGLSSTLQRRDSTAEETWSRKISRRRARDSISKLGASCCCCCGGGGCCCGSLAVGGAEVIGGAIPKFSKSPPSSAE